MYSKLNNIYTQITYTGTILFIFKIKKTFLENEQKFIKGQISYTRKIHDGEKLQLR